MAKEGSDYDRLNDGCGWGKGSTGELTGDGKGGLAL